MKFLASMLAAALVLTPMVATAKSDKARGSGSQMRTQMQSQPQRTAPGGQPGQQSSKVKKNDPCKNERAREVRQNPACANR